MVREMRLWQHQRMAWSTQDLMWEGEENHQTVLDLETDISSGRPPPASSELLLGLEWVEQSRAQCGMG